VYVADPFEGVIPLDADPFQGVIPEVAEPYQRLISDCMWMQNSVVHSRFEGV